MAKKIAVIGIGNSLRKDDGIGIVILKLLVKFYKRQDIDYFNFGGSIFDLLSRIKDYALVFFIDAINAGLKAGEIKAGRLEKIKDLGSFTITSTHEFNLNDILGFSKSLGLKTKMYLLGIQAQDTSFGETLSNALEAKKEVIAREISVLIDDILLKNA